MIDGQFVKIADTGQCLHTHCFRCVDCAVGLSARPYIQGESAAAADGKGTNMSFHCQDCYHRAHGPTCSACETVIMPSSGQDTVQYLVLEGNKYHATCFTCHECGTALASGQPGTVGAPAFAAKGKLYCPKHDPDASRIHALPRNRKVVSFEPIAEEEEDGGAGDDAPPPPPASEPATVREGFPSGWAEVGYQLLPLTSGRAADVHPPAKVILDKLPQQDNGESVPPPRPPKAATTATSNEQPESNYSRPEMSLKTGPMVGSAEPPVTHSLATDTGTLAPPLPLKQRQQQQQPESETHHNRQAFQQKEVNQRERPSDLPIDGAISYTSSGEPLYGYPPGETLQVEEDEAIYDDFTHGATVQSTAAVTPPPLPVRRYTEVPCAVMPNPNPTYCPQSPKPPSPRTPFADEKSGEQTADAARVAALLDEERRKTAALQQRLLELEQRHQQTLAAQRPISTAVPPPPPPPPAAAPSLLLPPLIGAQEEACDRQAAATAANDLFASVRRGIVLKGADGPRPQLTRMAAVEKKPQQSNRFSFGSIFSNGPPQLKRTGIQLAGADRQE